MNAEPIPHCDRTNSARFTSQLMPVFQSHSPGWVAHRAAQVINRAQKGRKH